MTTTTPRAPASATDRQGRMRVLVLAEQCNPAWTSVPLVGFNQALALSRHPDLDVVVATQVRNRADLEADARRAELDVIYIDTEWVAAPFNRIAGILRRNDDVGHSIQTAMAVPSYLAFEAQIRRHLGNDLADFDIIHRITPVSPVTPSSMPRRTTVPTVIGPINGGLPFPEEFAEMAERENDGILRLRALHRMVPHSRSMFTRSGGVIVASSHTDEETRPLRRGLTLRMSENGIDETVFPIDRSWPEPVDGRFRFVTTGRLVPAKSFDLLIDAFAGSGALADAELHIIGEGVERERLEAQVERLGVGDRVRLRGWLGQPEIAATYATSQAFVFASVKEFGGGVILEAMASALPCVVVGYGGPGDLVDPDTGIAVPMDRRPRVVEAMRAAMERLAHDPDLSRRLGETAAHRVAETHTWSVKADRLADFYRDVISRQQDSAASSRARSRA